ncbi:MAG: GNAT family N-acetyltransferase [Pseudomonadota bacterium]
MPSDIAILQAANALLDEQNGFSTFLTTDRHAKPLGIMTVTNAISLKTGESYAIIIEIYVSPSQRSKGVGDFMIEHLSIMGKSLGWTHIETLVPQKGRNVRAIGFFRQCGFKRIATAMTLKLK